MWVRSKYTSELAVLAAWVSLLVPWNVVYHPEAPVGSTVYFFRFALFELQVRRPTVLAIEGETFDASPALDTRYPGVELAGDLFVTIPPVGALEYNHELLQYANVSATIGAIAFALAFALSIALYVRTDATVERLPTSEVRVMGALLGVAALATAGASVLYYLDRDIAGIPIPVGVVIIGTFAAVLLQTEAVPDEEANGGESNDDGSEESTADAE